MDLGYDLRVLSMLCALSALELSGSYDGVVRRRAVTRFCILISLSLAEDVMRRGAA